MNLFNFNFSYYNLITFQTFKIKYSVSVQIMYLYAYYLL